MAVVAQDVTGAQWNEPATRQFPIVPSDTDELPFVVRSIYVGSTGSVSVMSHFGDIATYAAVPTGQILPVRARKVFATGTTASGLVGMY